MILIDTNSLIVLILGLINPNMISDHKRTSIYEKEDFYNLIGVIENLEKLIILPNVWTEVDNLLNNFTGTYKYQYISKITETIKKSTEKYIKTLNATESQCFYDLGLTDTLILEHAKECKFLITSDSALSDYAIANGIKVYDMIKIKNQKFK